MFAVFNINAFSMFSMKSPKTITFIVNIFMPVIYLGELADVAYPDWQGIKTETTAGARGEAG